MTRGTSTYAGFSDTWIDLISSVVFSLAGVMMNGYISRIYTPGDLRESCKETLLLS